MSSGSDLAGVQVIGGGGDLPGGDASGQGTGKGIPIFGDDPPKVHFFDDLLKLDDDVKRDLTKSDSFMSVDFKKLHELALHYFRRLNLMTFVCLLLVFLMNICLKRNRCPMPLLFALS